MRRRLLLSLFSLAATLGVFAVFEGGLRVVGYQGEPDRTVSWSPEHTPPEPPFFPVLTLDDGHPYRAARTPSQPHPWAEQKPAGVHRFIALGGSAVHGYGFFRSASWPDKLEERVAIPGGDVEVLNLGAIAYSSQQLVMLMKEARELEPDGVLVYAGNNEFLEWAGARRYLPEPEFRRWVSGVTMARRLRGFRTYRLLASFLSEQPGVYGQVDFRQVEPIPDVERAPMTADDRQFGETAFRLNLQRLVELADGVPVFVATPGTNLAYQPSETDAACVPEQSERTGAADRALQDGRVDEALALADEAFEACPESKQAWLWGEALRRHGETELARTWLERAMLLDASPNRAPPYLVQIVEELGGITLVDGKGALEELSADGLIGWDQVYDHCHPTPQGHDALAEAFAAAINRPTLPPPTPPDGHVDGWTGPEPWPLDPETERVEWWLASVSAEKTTAADWNHQGLLAWNTHDGSCVEGRNPCFDDAVTAFERALEVDPTFCVAHANLGRLYFAVGHPAAGDELDAATACDPADERSAWYAARLSGRSATFPP
ncbi:MAG: hypothetical protein GY913_28370 [Proteobacteria bacterium]|nr:hypothetical protein [Pseudomonadota bacterium]MCP4920828.1 hypothetical protein [Pseudomonadota bacterium]